MIFQKCIITLLNIKKRKKKNNYNIKKFIKMNIIKLIIIMLMIMILIKIVNIFIVMQFHKKNKINNLFFIKNKLIISII